MSSPGQLETLRAEILRRSGCDLQRQVELTKAAVQVIADAMVAEKITHHTYQGKVVEHSVDVDHTTRLQGARDLAVLLGLQPSKSAPTQGKGDTTVNVLVAGRVHDGQVVDAEAPRVLAQVVEGAIAPAGQAEIDLPPQG